MRKLGYSKVRDYRAGLADWVEVKGFSAHDGIGIALARRAGLKTGVITKRRSESLARRARRLAERASKPPLTRKD